MFGLAVAGGRLFAAQPGRHPLPRGQALGRLIKHERTSEDSIGNACCRASVRRECNRAGMASFSWTKWNRYQSG